MKPQHRFAVGFIILLVTVVLYHVGYRLLFYTPMDIAFPPRPGR